jgi:hypothetical protein
MLRQKSCPSKNIGKPEPILEGGQEFSKGNEIDSNASAYAHNMPANVGFSVALGRGQPTCLCGQPGSSSNRLELQ